MTNTPQVRPSTTLVTDNLSAMISEALQAVEQLMYNAVDSDVVVLRDASRHILEAGGKRIRPRLAILSYIAAGGETPLDVVPPTAALELMHTASVVHDDINDHGVVRRGRPSVNAIWGRTFALLTGDFLFTKVYELMAPHHHLNVILAEAAVALVEGETLQASAVKENKLSRDVYIDIIGRKTAALFRASAQMGAELAHSPRAWIDAIASFGWNIGLAFQIVDDILDLTGTTEDLGKTAGIDIEQGKGFASTLASETGENNVMENIKAKLMNKDTIAKGREQANALIQAAISDLDILPDSESKKELIALARSVVDRTF